jgi:hypothetical protein
MRLTIGLVVAFATLMAFSTKVASALQGACRAAIVNKGPRALQPGAGFFGILKFDGNFDRNRFFSSTCLNCVSGEELANALPDCKRRLGEVEEIIETNMGKAVLDLPGLRQQIKDMELESSQPEFWDDADSAQKFMSDLTRVKALVGRIEGWTTSCGDIQGAIELCAEDSELADEFITEALITLKKLEKDLDAFELERLLGGKYDKNGCTLCIQSGAGGTEAQDWAGMLYRMYKRFCERKGYKVTIIEEMSADFGIKSCEIKIEGDYAYVNMQG